MIVKVQLPLATNEATPKALIYNQSRNFEIFHGITPHIREKMAGRPKAFFEMDITQDEPIFVRELPDQGW